MKVSVLGPRGSYSEQAAKQFFGECELNYCLTISDVVNSINNNVFGVIPFENSLQGSVVSAIDSLINSNALIIGEIVLNIRHVLAVNKEFSKAKKIVSHPQALGQCSNKLRELFPKVIMEPVSSTSRAAELARSNPELIAVCSKYAAEINDLRIISECKNDNNQTRFVVLGTSIPKPTGNDRTTIIVGLGDRVGALYDLLRLFKDKGINLTRIESRPSKKGLGDYLFLIEFEGHKDNVNELLINLRSNAFFKLLGSYPKNFNKNDS